MAGVNECFICNEPSINDARSSRVDPRFFAVILSATTADPERNIPPPTFLPFTSRVSSNTSLFTCLLDNEVVITSGSDVGSGVD